MEMRLDETPDRSTDVADANMKLTVTEAVRNRRLGWLAMPSTAGVPTMAMTNAARLIVRSHNRPPQHRTPRDRCIRAGRGFARYRAGTENTHRR